MNCQISPGCVQVQVDVPANDVLTDIDVCDLGKSLIIEHVLYECLSSGNQLTKFPHHV